GHPVPIRHPLVPGDQLRLSNNRATILDRQLRKQHHHHLHHNRSHSSDHHQATVRHHQDLNVPLRPGLMGRHHRCMVHIHRREANTCIHQPVPLILHKDRRPNSKVHHHLPKVLLLVLPSSKVKAHSRHHHSNKAHPVVLRHRMHILD